MVRDQPARARGNPRRRPRLDKFRAKPEIEVLDRRELLSVVVTPAAGVSEGTPISRQTAALPAQGFLGGQDESASLVDSGALQSAASEKSFVVYSIPAVVPARVPFSDVLVGTVSVSTQGPVSANDFHVLLVPTAEPPESTPPLLSASIKPRSGAGDGVFDILATGQFASRGLIKTSLTVIRISTSEAETVSTGPEIRAVLPGPLPVAGRLAPFADTGVSTSDAITATAFPVFVGTAPPYTVVLLYGRRFDHKEETLLGRTMATASGDWQLTVGPVPDGRYTIQVTGAVPDADPEPIYLYSENNPLVIDTVGLAVVKVERDSLMPGLRVYFQPDSGGFDLPTLQEATHYTIQGGKRFGLPLATAISAELEAPTANYVTVGLRFDPRGFPRRGALAINGIRDIAGNVLSGVFPMTTHAYPTRLRRFR